jgi:Kef-type K+ transport system membrane component KefB
MPQEVSPRRVLPLLIYFLSIAGVIGGFLLIQTRGEHLISPSPAFSSAGLSAGPYPHVADLLHVLLALVAVVGLARVLGTLFRAIQQPPVIGEIIAGIVLGPSLFGRISPTASAYLFPVNVGPPLNIISQVGVILFMFLVGVELDLGLLRKRGHATIAISHASILAPFFLGAMLSILLYPRLSTSDVSFTDFALFLGVSMSVTAFPVLARILTDRRISKTRLGALALTCAAVDDVTAWCLLAFVVGVARAESAGFVRTVGWLAAYIGTMIIVVRPGMNRLAVVYGNKGRLTQGLMAIIFVMLLLSAAATELIGIHAIFGAFALGATISHDSGMARELVDRLEDLVVVLLLPAFFAFTGLRTQIGLVSGPDQWLLCVLIILVASMGKFGGSLIAARITGLSWRDSSSLGVLMNTRGLMELIVLNMGFEMHIISPALFAMMVLMALVTTFATTPILHLIVGDSEQDAPVPALPGRDEERDTILVPVANPDGVERLLRLALAATLPGGAPPRVLALVPRPAGGVRATLSIENDRSAPRSAALGAALDLVWGEGAVITPQAIWSDDPATDLVRVAMESRVGWVLLGPHRAVFGADFRGGIVRSILERTRDLPINVAVAMQGREMTFERLFAVVDATRDGRAALQLATRVAITKDASLHVIRITGAVESAEVELSRELSESARAIGRRLHTEAIASPTLTLTLLAERTAMGLLFIAAGIAERLGVAGRGLPDHHAVVLVQGSQSTLNYARGSARIGLQRTAWS